MKLQTLPTTVLPSLLAFALGMLWIQPAHGTSIPVIAGISPDTGASLFDGITTAGDWMFSGTAQAGSTVTLVLQGTGVIASTTADASGRWSIDTAGLVPAGDGTWNFTASATDAMGISSTSAVFPVTRDTKAPTVVSINRQSPGTANVTPGGNVTFRVTFSETVTGVTSGDFTLTPTGTAGGTIGAVTMFNFSTYDVTVNNVQGDFYDTLRLDLNNNWTGIIDTAGNEINGRFTSGQTYTVSPQTGNGTWINTASGGLWGNLANWSGGTVAAGLYNTASFSTLEVTADNTVHLDLPQMINRLIFGDTDTATAAGWLVDNNAGTANILTLTGSLPTIVVNALGVGKTATISAGLAGTAGFTKSGTGTLVLSGANPLTGAIIIGNSTASATSTGGGILRLDSGCSLTVSTLVINTLSTNGTVSSGLVVNGGTFLANGTTTLVGGTGVLNATPARNLIEVDSGTATFAGAFSTSQETATMKITGGTVTFRSTLNFFKSAYNSGSATTAHSLDFSGTAGGLIITGGNTTVSGNVAIALAGGSSALVMSGGTVTLNKGLLLANRVTAANRGGGLRVSGGTFALNDTSRGIVLVIKGTSVVNGFAVAEFAGGVSTVGKFTLAGDSSQTTGQGQIYVDGGALYVGAGGIATPSGTSAAPGAYVYSIKLGGSGWLPGGTVVAGASNVGSAGGTQFTGDGILGADANWSSALNISLAGNTALAAADAGGTAHNITLSGVLSGAGGLVKTGGGTLTLSGSNTYTGMTAVNGGTLEINGSLAADSGTVTINANGILAGAGMVNPAITLNSGGAIAPGTNGTAGTLQGTALTWNAGGRALFDLGLTSDQLALSGALTKGGGTGACGFVFNCGTSPAPGTTVTLATFGSTNFAAQDFSYSGSGFGPLHTGSFAVGANSLTFTVGPDASYAGWCGTIFTPSELQDPSVSGTACDPDQDGIPNLLEYAFGLSPKQSERSGLPVAGVVPVNGRQYLTLTYTRLNLTSDLTYSIQASSDLATWSTITPVVTNAVNNGATQTVTVRDTVALDVSTPRFLRVAVAASGQQMTSDAVGGFALSFDGTGGTVASALSFVGLGLTRPVEYQGRIDRVSDSTIVQNSATWADNAYNGTNSAFFLEITSGPQAGLMLDVVATTAATHALTLGNSVAGLLTGGEMFKLRRHWTLGSLFGATNSAGLGAGTLTTADQVQVLNSTTQSLQSYYYKTLGVGGTGWRLAGGSASADTSGTVIHLGEGFLLSRRQPAALTFLLIGAVKTGPTQILLNPGYNYATNICAAGALTLNASQLYTGTPATGLAGGTLTTADQVQIFNSPAQNTQTYYYKTSGAGGTGWRLAGGNISADASSTVLAIGQCFLINRKAATPLIWTVPPSFQNNVSDTLPSTTLTASTTSPGFGQTFTLTSTATDPDGNLVSQTIDCLPPGADPDTGWISGSGSWAAGSAWSGNPTGGNTISCTFTPEIPGAWQFRSRSSDSAGAAGDFSCLTVTVPPPPPPSVTAAFSASTICYGQTLSITSTISSPIGCLSENNLFYTLNGGLWSWQNGPQPGSQSWQSLLSPIDATVTSNTRTFAWIPTILGAYDFVAEGWTGFTGNSRPGATGGYPANASYATPCVVHVVKATPAMSWGVQAFTGPHTISAADLAATVANPYTPAVSQPTEALTYSIVSASGSDASPKNGPVSAGTVLQPGAYTLRAAYPGDACYNASSLDTMFVVQGPGDAAHAGLPPGNPLARSGYFFRGMGNDPNCHTFVVAMDFQKGVELSPMGGNAKKFGNLPAGQMPWFTRVLRDTTYHVTVENGIPSYDRLPFENPLAAFGSQAGGSPLLVDQHYRFGFYAGYFWPKSYLPYNLVIWTYRKSDFANGAVKVPPAYCDVYFIPGPYDTGAGGQADWDDFVKNGYIMTVNTHGLETKIQYAAGSDWGTTWNSPIILDHKAGSDDCVYFLSLTGGVAIPGQTYGFPMAITQPSITAPNVFSTISYGYTLDFDRPGSWQSIFVHQPHFDGKPAPSDYVLGDTALLAPSAAGAPALVEGGFENPTVGTGQYVEPVQGSAWTFEAQHAGISANGSPLLPANLNQNAPEGSHVAVLRYDGWISQGIHLPSGTYVVSLKSALRAGDPAPKSIKISVDGAAVDTLTLSETGWQEFVTQSFTVEEGDHLLKFEGVDPNNAGGALLDDVRLEPFAPAVDPSACLRLDHSPELRRHPFLDKFVADLDNDPIALANYVSNEIELTDPLSFNENGDIAEQSINQGGVNRGALATFMEGQGSPWEQCALLVYFLRQAGIPAVYVEPQHNRLQMFDSDLSKIMRVQLSGAVDNQGALYSPVGRNLIAVNYPWVAAWLADQQRWVHLFPWIKDTEVTEGYDLYDFLPAGYDNGKQWVNRYLQLDPQIHSSDDSDDTLTTLFPKFIGQSLRDTRPDLTIDNLGVRFLNRRNYRSRWEDFLPAVRVGGRPQPVESLQFKNNIFNTVSFELSSVNNPSRKITTGDLRVLDLHNRRLAARTTKTGSNTHALSFTLAPFRPDATGGGNFSVTSDLLAGQRLTLALDGSDGQVNLRIDHHRHRNFPGLASGWPGYWALFLGQNYTLNFSRNIAFQKGDLAAVCLNLGRVTDRMLQTHVEDHWQIEQLRKTNPAAVDPEVAEDALAYLMGMNYYRNTSRFADFSAQLHKRHILSEYAVGLAKFVARRIDGVLPNNGEIQLNQAGLDMFFAETAVVSNGTIHADSDAPWSAHLLDEFPISSTECSAQEHNTIRTFFGDDQAVSTVRLLRIAQENGPPGIIFLTKTNYLSEGEKSYAVAGETHALKDWSASIWSSVVQAFSDATYSDFTYAFITPGAMSSPENAYQGMGAFIYAPLSCQALIQGNTGGINGGFGGKSVQQQINTGSLIWHDDDPLVLPTLTITDPVPAPDIYNPVDFEKFLAAINNGSYLLTPTEQRQYAVVFSLVSDEQWSDDSAWLAAEKGDLSAVRWLRAPAQFLADPVNAVTGEFYNDHTDLRLEGPMPLEIRRNYSSRNFASNEFGFGWLLNYSPNLVVKDDESVIYAADPEGSVIAYRRQGTSEVWAASPDSNPESGNDSGGLQNAFNARIVRTVAGGATQYDLSMADGSTRTYRVRSFPIDTLTRTRPYLERWTDDRGNAHTFTYGEDPADKAYGHMTKIQSSNGNFVGFNYDLYGHIVEAFAADGRRVEYSYNESGDLTDVTLPDGAVFKYKYGTEQTALPQTGGQPASATTSNHLLVREIKPEGRILENTYDGSRRVVRQNATVGPDMTPVVNATFDYGEPGKTKIYDAYGRLTVYEYQNGLVRRITDPLNQTVLKDWYAVSDAATGACQRSLKSVTDQRGLLTEYKYDERGNQREVKLTGDLDGDPATIETAVTTTVYNARNQPASVTNPSGLTTEFSYEDTNYPYLPTKTVVKKGADTIREDHCEYMEKRVSDTLFSRGLLLRKYTAWGSADEAKVEFDYNTAGFPTKQTAFTGTADPDMVATYFYNLRGEKVEEDDADGRSTHYSYDAMGRPTVKEVRDEQGVVMGTWRTYYNGNGEAIWLDGPRSGPEDWVRRNYDGAGRITEELVWRSQAKADGSGVEAPGGDAQFAKTSSGYDLFGNLRWVTDPRGSTTTMEYDAIGRLTLKQACAGTDSNSAALMRTEFFEYEPGGGIAKYTNPLGGVTRKFYTATGELRRQENLDGSTLEWRYFPDGRLQKEILRNGVFWETAYDDVARKLTRTLKKPDGAILAVESRESDRRGNPVKHTDAEGNVTTMSYDDLNRVKTVVGPAGTAGSAQQTVTTFYAASARTLRTRNGLNEDTVTTSDALGRPVRIEIKSAAGDVVRVTAWAYSSDHNAVTVTEGSGANAVATTTFTDPAGHVLLTRFADGKFAASQYDSAGNLLSTTDELGQITQYDYDPLGQMKLQKLPDGTTTAFAYDAAGNLIARTMAGGTLADETSYDSAGRKISSRLRSGGTITRQFSCQYYASGPFTGLLQKTTDPRGTVHTAVYDDFLRPLSVTSDGAAAETDLTTVYAYDKRGLLTAITQSSPNHAAGPDTQVTRQFDGCGQLTEEKVSVGGVLLSHLLQTWDAAGRRSSLGKGGGVPSIGLAAGTARTFGYRADGAMSSVTTGSQAFTFGYLDNGLLSSRSGAGKSFAVNTRDARGRITSANTTVGLTTPLAETLVWRADSKIDTYAVQGQGAGARNEIRDYSYDSRNQLISEGYAPTKTLTYQFDHNVAGGLGVLTSARLDATWETRADVVDAFGRTTNEWRNNAVALAQDPAGAGALTTTYDEAGNATGRTFADGRVQTLTWDGLGRLVRMSQRNALSHGFDWTAVYDGLGRRLRTTYQTIQSGAATGAALTTDSWYDPQVEFLEIAVSVNGTRVWKIYGPDLNGVYGSLQGTGGFEATIIESDGTIKAILNDLFGNGVVSIAGGGTGGQVAWFATQAGAYGPLPGTLAEPLTDPTRLAEATTWRGRRIDPTGLYNLGARYYDPISARFLSPDPLGHAATPSLYAYATNDPVNLLDPDGRFGKDSNDAGSSNSGFDGRVYVWDPRWFEFSPGHGMLTDNSPGRNVHLSEFPRGAGGMDDGRNFLNVAWNAFIGNPNNRRLTFAQTIAQEGKPADWIFELHLPDRDAVLAAVRDQAIKTPTWAPFSGNSLRTQCTTSISNVIISGGLSGINATMPETLARQLLHLATEPPQANGASVRLIYSPHTTYTHN